MTEKSPGASQCGQEIQMNDSGQFELNVFEGGRYNIIVLLWRRCIP